MIWFMWVHEFKVGSWRGFSLGFIYSPAGGWCHAMPGNTRTGAGVAHRPDHPEGRCSSPESVAHHMHSGDLAELTQPCLSCPSGDSLDSGAGPGWGRSHPNSTPWCSACAVADCTTQPSAHLPPAPTPQGPCGPPVASSAVHPSLGLVVPPPPRPLELLAGQQPAATGQ